MSTRSQAFWNSVHISVRQPAIIPEKAAGLVQIPGRGAKWADSGSIPGRYRVWTESEPRRATHRCPSLSRAEQTQSTTPSSRVHW